MRNPATRGANTGLLNAAVAASVERFTAVRPFRQDLHIANRFGLPSAIAAAIAELPYPRLDHWSVRV